LPLGGQSVWAVRHALRRPDSSAHDAIENVTQPASARPVVLLTTAFDSIDVFQVVRLCALRVN
jgi:hypothetical protein